MNTVMVDAYKKARSESQARLFTRAFCCVSDAAMAQSNYSVVSLPDLLAIQRLQ